MPRRPAAVTQADVARTIRAAMQAGADSVKVNPDGTIVVVLKDGATDDAKAKVSGETPEDVTKLL
jgi:hypothetical protein